MKKIFILLTIITCSLSVAFNASADCSCFYSPSPIKAISLKRLQQKINKTSSNRHAGSYFQFFGIKTILGYVVDEKNHDLIIIGDDDNKFPDLYLEDFVIALRNAYLKYAPLKNNVYQFSYPGCSIDPRPSVINQLDIIGQKILQSTDDQQKFIKKWKKICRLPQDVRVMGIPFNSHFANVLVQADYDMKLIVDGSEKIEYLDSLSDMNLNQVKNDIINNRPVSVSTSMNRFWFYPGENIFEEGDGIIMIEKCPVTLLTNETYVNAKNKIVDGRGPNPYAQIFVDQFSKYYDHIASQRPIFKELENMFRFIALANIIKFQNPVTNSHLDYLLEDFPIKHKTVDPTLPGRSNVKRDNHRKNLPNGYQEIHFCLPSCGGVDARIDIKPEQFRRKKAKALSKIKNAVLKAKPKKAISWVAKIGHIPIISNYRDKIFLRRINNSSETASAIIVKQDRSNGNHVTYQTFDGHTEIYDGNEPIQLIDHLANYLKKNKTNKKHLISFKNFAEEKAEAMKGNFFKTFKSKGIDVNEIKSFRDNNDNMLLTAMFTPGAKWDGHERPIEKKGKTNAIMHFKHTFRQKMIHIGVKVLSKNPLAVKDYVNQTEKLSKSMKNILFIDMIYTSLEKVKKKYKTNIFIKIYLQCMRTFFVEIDDNQKNNTL